MQKNLDIINIKRIPKNLIDKTIGTLINVGNYQKGSYFKNQDSFLYLTCLDSLNALSISIDKIDLSTCKENKFELVISDKTEIVDLKLDKNTTNMKLIETEILKLNPVVGIFGKDEKMLEVLDKLDDRIKTKGYNSLIGMGLGLTPSGDDFIAGVLAYEFATRKKIITENLDFINTNHISREFLKYATKGIFSEDILKLLNNKIDFVEEILKSGHTSGADTLFGIYYAARISDNHF